jgi:hypothetical protein
MLSSADATKIVRREFPEGKIQAWIVYKDLYLFKIFSKDPGEEELDPFYSVDKDTGEFRDFSIIADGNINEVLDLFEKATKPDAKGGVE